MLVITRPVITAGLLKYIELPAQSIPAQSVCECTIMLTTLHQAFYFISRVRTSLLAAGLLTARHGGQALNVSFCVVNAWVGLAVLVRCTVDFRLRSLCAELTFDSVQVRFDYIVTSPTVACFKRRIVKLKFLL